jgi:hypothetical protein
VYYGREGDSRSLTVWRVKTYPIDGHQQSGRLLARLPAEEENMSRKLKSAVSRSHEEATVESFRKDVCRRVFERRP